MELADREQRFATWKRAVQRSLGWIVDHDHSNIVTSASTERAVPAAPAACVCFHFATRFTYQFCRSVELAWPVKAGLVVAALFVAWRELFTTA
jgi:uncharacterized protein (DUF2062 family)